MTTQGWQWTELDEVATVTAGNPAPQGEEFFAGGTHPFVRVQDLGRLGAASYLTATADHVNDKASKALKVFPKGSILFTKSGASLLLNQRAILGRDMHVVSHIGVAVPGQRVVSEWLYYWLRTVDFADIAHGANMPSLPLSRVKKIKVPVPPLEEQKSRVAEIEKQFSRLDEAVANLKRVKANLKRYKAAVLKTAVEGHFVETEAELARREGRSYETGEQLLQRILETRRSQWQGKGKYKQPAAPDTTDLSELPEGWVWALIGEAFDVFVGATPSRAKPEYWSGGIPWVSSGEVAFCRIKQTRETISSHGLENSSTYLHPAGTVLLGMIGEGKTRGQVAILDIEACNNQNSAAIRVSETKVLPEYIYSFLEKEYEDTRRRGSGGNQPALNKERVRQIPFPLPPVDEQKRIMDEINHRLSIVHETEAQVNSNLKRAEGLRQLILSRAFR